MLLHLTHKWSTSDQINEVRSLNVALMFILPLSPIPALESGVSGGFFGGFSSPIGMSRRAFSYDEALDAPMHSPPPDMCVNNPWKDPLIPQRKFKRIVEVQNLNTVSPSYLSCYYIQYRSL